MLSIGAVAASASTGLVAVTVAAAAVAAVVNYDCFPAFIDDAIHKF